MNVEHVDFVSVPVTDMERSVAWYRDTLGLPQSREGGFPEFKLGDNVFLYLIDPTTIGGEFKGGHGAPIALRVNEKRSCSSGSRVISAPPTVALCPSINFVVE